MPGIFISYRRDDSSGHAGRIGDRLRQRFGELVFQDVDNIADGEVFESVINRALSTCDVALIVIGRQWVKCIDPSGRRRIDDPNDWVRTEIRMVLSRSIRVIPILVGGAVMPAGEELPDELRPLLKRQARELRDTSWDSDMDALVKRLGQIIGEGKHHVATNARRPASAFPQRLIVFSGLALVLMGGVAWWLVHDRSSLTPAGDGTATTFRGKSDQIAGQASTATNPGTSDGRPAPPAQATTFVSVPPPGQVRLGATAYEILSIRREPYDVERDALTFAIRMTNREGFALNFWSSSFKLMVDGAMSSPSDSLNAIVEPRAALDGEVAFTVPKSARQMVLQIGTNEKNTKVPIDTSVHAPAPVAADSVVLPRQTQLPVRLPAGAKIRIAEVHYEVLSAEIDRHNYEVDTIEVRIRVRATNKGRYDAAFSDADVRLLVDGTPRAAARTARFYERLQGGATIERDLTFIETRPAQQLSLGVVDRGAERYATVPLLPKSGT